MKYVAYTIVFVLGVYASTLIIGSSSNEEGTQGREYVSPYAPIECISRTTDAVKVISVINSSNANCSNQQLLISKVSIKEFYPKDKCLNLIGKQWRCTWFDRFNNTVHQSDWTVE